MTSANAMLVKVRTIVTWTPAQSCGDQATRSSKVRDKGYSRPGPRTVSAGRATKLAPRRYCCSPGSFEAPALTDPERCAVGTSPIGGDQGLRKKSVGVRPHLVKILSTVPSFFISA